MSGGRIPRAFIDDLLVRVDIVELIDTHVSLKKTGANYVARCPFHTEKTPSFSVNRHKQYYHCFGCGVSGNAISFLMDFNHLDFIEAVEDLAHFAGLEVPRESVENWPDEKKGDLSSLYGVMEHAATLYSEYLRSNASGKMAADYLKSRGISGDVAKEYLLGYAPSAWKSLVDRFDLQLLLGSGLLGRNDEGSVYARFRNRVMFPIRDKRGRVVGFGGRVLDDSLPKYLNSPETLLFHKGKEVYGLYELLQKNSKPQRIVIVEGYMDVIALAQFGIHYAVATLGTAASQAHLELLFRFTPELVFCFDGDKAGREAAWRAMDSVFPCLRDGRLVRIALLPQNEDPDSLIRKAGVADFVERLRVAETLSDYFFSQVSQELNLLKLEGRAQLINKAKPFLDKLPEGVFREMMFGKLKELSGYGLLDVLDNEAKLKQNNAPQAKFEKGRLSSARTAIALLVQNPGLAEFVEQMEIDWDRFDFPGVDLFKIILNKVAQYRPMNVGMLLEIFRGSAEEKTIKTLAFLPMLVPAEGVEFEFRDAFNRLLAQSRTVAMERLLSKERLEGLNNQEKESLRKLLLEK